MSDISEEYFDDEDIAPDDDNMQGSDGFAAQSQGGYDDRAGEGPIETGRYNNDIGKTRICLIRINTAYVRLNPQLSVAKR
jgi:hypothetical protein